MVKDLIFCLQEAALYFISKKPWTPKQPSECFVNPPCGCANPGQDLKCEECPHLEACLSSFKLQESGGCNIAYIPDIPTLQLTNSGNKYETIAEVEIREKSKSY
ncbi:hypothetical protein WKK05_22280 [Nostoc sp. UHCC 0302]|uniref:hypothetical protein n=1 Tax=Nostoc sp. UHCC 0302 TaxID=3134896 RepID=UPI00311CA3F6